MIILSCTACQHWMWQKRAKVDWMKKHKKNDNRKCPQIIKHTPNYGIGVIFFFVGLLMFKLFFRVR